MSLLKTAIANSKKCFANKDAFLNFLPGRPKKTRQGGVGFRLWFYDKSVDNRSTNPPTVTRRDPLMPPYEPFIELDHWKGPCSHYIILNRYMFCPGHIIMALDHQKEIQGSKLKHHDFATFSKLIQSVDDRGVAYYNGGVEAGCTQYHKHMQYVPYFDNPLFDHMAAGKSLPYRYFAQKLADYKPTTIALAYWKLFSDAKHDGSYNFLISKKTAVLVPRSKAKHEAGVLVNSMGVCGHLFVSDKNYKEVAEKPLEILKSVCVEK